MSTVLGEFLRSRRDAARPADFGLPAGARRRVPGLRRSELAALAGISVEYLVRLEQGRDRNPSESVLRALAGALRLGVAERDHLWHLTRLGGPVCGVSGPQPRSDLRPGVLRVLDQLEPGIAVVGNRLGDVLAYTTAFGALARPSGLLDGDRPNLTRYVFTHPRARETFPDWDRVADERAYDLWLGPSAVRSERFRAELADEAGEPFTRRVDRHAMPAPGPLRWRHPDAELRLEREVLELGPEDAQQLVVHLPADDATADALSRIGRASHLRLVP